LGAGFFGDKDENIVLDERLAGKPVAIRAHFLNEVAFFLRGRSHMVWLRDDAVLVERALFDLNLALPTGEPTGAYAFDFDAKLARSIQQGFALLDATTSPRGQKMTWGAFFMIV
jgi:hypothetical protein